jgi:AcrR family transcriptional regulator
MTTEASTPKLRKGERTALKILEVAERLFAERGYNGTSLREIADQVGIKEPGLYKYFTSKDALYEAVLESALRPMSDAMNKVLERVDNQQELLLSTPSIMMDLLAEHPYIPTLFQRALLADDDSNATQVMTKWLDELFRKGAALWEHQGHTEMNTPDGVAMLMMFFNLTTGYFSSRNWFARLGGGDVLDAENLEKQKELLNIVMAALISRHSKAPVKSLI